MSDLHIRLINQAPPFLTYSYTVQQAHMQTNLKVDLEHLAREYIDFHKGTPLVPNPADCVVEVISENTRQHIERLEALLSKISQSGSISIEEVNEIEATLMR
jgi:hypothetical protein